MRIDFISLFPETLEPFLDASILGRASRAERVAFRAINPRTFCTDRHQKVDDTPFGGHPGMLIKAEPTALAVESLEPSPDAAIILTSPSAKTFTQADAAKLVKRDQIILLCGHYEGFDHRVETEIATHVYSVGDFVLTNGELPALCIADAVTRLIPGVLGDHQSLEEDSHSDGLLSAPNFTRPEVWRGVSVPEVLLSGNHSEIKKWRRRYSLEVSMKFRPDLVAKAALTKQDLALLTEISERQSR